MHLSNILLGSACALYAAAFACHLVSFLGKGGSEHPFASGFLRVGFLISTLFFLEEAARQKYFLPVYGASQALAFFAWSLAFVYLVLFVRIQRESFGLVLTPILVLLSGGAAASFSDGRLYQPDSAVFSNAYFILHVVNAFFAYACFTISFAAGILYLIQQRELKSKQAGRFYHKFPSLEALETLVFQPMIWGALLLSAAIGAGIFWSKSSYGVYGLTDPKTIATLLTIAVYFIVLYLHHVARVRGKKVTVFSLIAFGMILVSFIGMRFVENSHNFIRA